MSTGANTSVRGHIDAKLRKADRKGGNQTDQIENMTEAKPVTPSNPPKISHFPDDFFNNIGQGQSHAPSVQVSSNRTLAGARDPRATAGGRQKHPAIY